MPAIEWAIKMYDRVSDVFSQCSLFRVVLLFFLLSGCATLSTSYLASKYGEASPKNRIVEKLPEGEIDFWTEVKPILDNRCVVCHGCYDAPCQLKMTAIEGIERGAHKTSVYNTTRLAPANLTRLFEDAQSVDQWRRQGFTPVLNEHENSLMANREASVLYQSLMLKKEHPLPHAKILDDSFTLGLNRKENCPSADEMPEFSRKNPLWGMPYALPALDQNEIGILSRWVEQGAQYAERKDISAKYIDNIERWEKFLNQGSMKSQLVSRYIYEHLFLANIYFSEEVDDVEPVFFKLVRSSTASGEPVQRIATRRPYDPPGSSNIYYRFIPELETTVSKNHLPYVLNMQRMDRWQSLFFESEYTVDYLPSYDVAVASNPFDSFLQLPLKSRYKFLLDEAQFSIMNFIKGPVCRGNVALNVINDHFWVFFLDPDIPLGQEISDAVLESKSSLELSSSAGSTFNPIYQWNKYAAKEKKNRENRDKFLLQHINNDEQPIDLAMVWDGDGHNHNASLTVFRHGDTATVEKGLIGDSPKTAWIISYPLLERIHYLLVAGYDVYGNISHNLMSRMHMDFLRMDGEVSFLMMLPQSSREFERQMWYRGASKSTIKFLTNQKFEMQVQSNIHFKTESHKTELYGLLKQYLGAVLPRQYSLSGIGDSSVEKPLMDLSAFKGEHTRYLPEVSLLHITDKAQNRQWLVTIIKNSAHKNITSMFFEEDKLLPEENTLSIVHGVIGAYPNVLLKVEVNSLQSFTDSALSIRSEAEYSAWLDQFAIRRTNSQFWQHSDNVHNLLKRYDGIRFGRLDYNRLENR